MSFFNWFSKSSSTSSTPNADDIVKKDVCYHIEGFLACSYFHTATEAADRLAAKYPNVKIDVSAYPRQQWPERSLELQKEFDTTHRTSPFIYEGCSAGNQKVVGGYTDFAKLIKTNYQMIVPMD
ncbi:uncharacterized protein BX664DRAFT_334309 [Halteromyces radiatus]|uniref:uncharacterized protein n=1 Tax=Halteromyces radiatus TaxID=101107 RepID=UPI0022209F4F|nr:uncharacterized protein BX664DRAFT_334309 [Halteromyces radiatus]KAI8089956.1 hypothetical protein BX664DRAFT_334309 [Halteromyces radiatus]